MKFKGKVFKSQFRGDYWKIIKENNTMLLIEATYFSGRPRPSTRDCSKDEDCPFPYCNYKRNQFCLSKEPSNFTHKKEISRIDFELRVMKGEVIFSDWTNHIAGKEPPTNTKGYKR